MRILHVLDHSAPLHSGYTFRTLALMREQIKRGWEPVLLTGPKQASGSVTEEDADGWHFYRTPEPVGYLAQQPVVGEFKLMAATRRRLEDVLATVRPDLIHAHSPVLNGYPAMRAARQHNLPFVYEVRAFWEDAAVEHGSCKQGDMRYRATRAAESYVLKRADAVMTICDGLRNDILDRGVSASRVTVIPNAVDVERFSVHPEVDERLRESLGLSGDYVLGFAGSFYAYEGLEIAIRAMAQPAMKSRAVMLLLVGGGPEAERLKTLALDLGVANRVVFTGRVPNAEIERYYALIDLLVFPRLQHRLTEIVTPLKPLEAMAQRRLVAASDVGGHRELIRDGETAFLFEPESPDALANCVCTTMDKPAAQLDAVRDAGRQFVENERTWAASVAAYQPVYESLLAAGPGK